MHQESRISSPWITILAALSLMLGLATTGCGASNGDGTTEAATETSGKDEEATEDDGEKEGEGKEDEEILIISAKGQRIRSSLSELRVLSRRTQGVSIFTLPEEDSVVSIASMEPRVRTDRDTKPRQVGKPAATVEVPVEEPSVNGHRNGQQAEEEPET